MTRTPSIGPENLSRRGLITAMVAAGLTVPLGFAGRAGAAPAAAARSPRGRREWSCPHPPGRYRVGTVALHLVDPSRPDPVAGPGHYRELMASVWYPRPGPRALSVRRRWMPAAPVARAARVRAISTPTPRRRRSPPATRARRYAAAAERWPVIVFSHGAHDHRSDTTIVVQELASHGYVVVTVDHTYDAFSEFPDGRLTVPQYDVSALPRGLRRTTSGSSSTAIEDLAAGRNPDAEHRPLPAGLGAALDLHRIGMFGWSKGATATALVMGTDRARPGRAELRRPDGVAAAVPPSSTGRSC